MNGNEPVRGAEAWCKRVAGAATEVLDKHPFDTQAGAELLAQSAGAFPVAVNWLTKAAKADPEGARLVREFEDTTAKLRALYMEDLARVVSNSAPPRANGGVSVQQRRGGYNSSSDSSSSSDERKSTKKRKEKRKRSVADDDSSSSDSSDGPVKVRIPLQRRKNNHTYGESSNKRMKNGKFTVSESKEVIADAKKLAAEAGYPSLVYMYSSNVRERQRLKLFRKLEAKYTERTAESLSNHVKRLVAKAECKTGPWSENEFRKLKEMVAKEGKDWKLIGKALNRFPTSCRDKYKASVADTGNGLIKGKFSSEESEKLIRVVLEQFGGKMPDGTIHFHPVARKVGNRSWLQCRDHWNHTVHPRLEAHGRTSDLSELTADEIVEIGTTPIPRGSVDMVYLIRRVLDIGYEHRADINWKQLGREMHRPHHLLRDRFTAMLHSHFHEPLPLREACEKMLQMNAEIGRITIRSSKNYVRFSTGEHSDVSSDEDLGEPVGASGGGVVVMDNFNGAAVPLGVPSNHANPPSLSAALVSPPMPAISPARAGGSAPTTTTTTTANTAPTTTTTTSTGSGSGAAAAAGGSGSTNPLDALVPSFGSQRSAVTVPPPVSVVTPGAVAGSSSTPLSPVPPNNVNSNMAFAVPRVNQDTVPLTLNPDGSLPATNVVMSMMDSQDQAHRSVLLGPSGAGLSGVGVGMGGIVGPVFGAPQLTSPPSGVVIGGSGVVGGSGKKKDKKKGKNKDKTKDRSSEVASERDSEREREKSKKKKKKKKAKEKGKEQMATEDNEQTEQTEPSETTEKEKEHSKNKEKKKKKKKKKDKGPAAAAAAAQGTGYGV